MKWLIKKLTFDWRKVPRPERSGYLSVLLVYTAMCFYGEVNGNYVGEGFSIRCLWMPWECMKQEQVKEDKPEPERAYAVTPLIYCPKCRVREHPQRCFVHMDVSATNPEEDLTAGITWHMYPIIETTMSMCENSKSNGKWIHLDRYASVYTIRNLNGEQGSYGIQGPTYARFHIEIE